MKAFSSYLILPITLLLFGLSPRVAIAQVKIYKSIPLQVGSEIKDTLSDKDIPTGRGGFARDYVVSLKKGDQVMIELKSDSFDTIIALLTTDGATVGENAADSDDTNNSLLFAKIVRSGNYIVRVSSFSGEPVGGTFMLKVVRLRPE